MQGTYRDFRVMRMNETPVIETRIATSNRRPDGFKEHPAPPVAPAIANAVFAATGMHSPPADPRKRSGELADRREVTN